MAGITDLKSFSCTVMSRRLAGVCPVETGFKPVSTFGPRGYSCLIMRCIKRKLDTGFRVKHGMTKKDYTGDVLYYYIQGSLKKHKYFRGI